MNQLVVTVTESKKLCAEKQAAGEQNRCQPAVGSSAQRVEWFWRDLQSDDVDQCDTFS